MSHEDSNKNYRSDARARLLKAATLLFAQKGYTATSVREIVEQAGVTKPVLYYYFRNKEGIFHAILDCAGEYQEGILTQVLGMSGKALDRLIFLYHKVYEAIIENQDLFKLIHNLVFGPVRGVPGYDLEGFHRRMASAIKGIYMDGLNKGEVKQVEPEDVAFLVQGLLDFCCHMDFIKPGLSDPRRPERLLRLAFMGLEKVASTK